MSDTGPAKLPGIPQLATKDQGLASWAQAITEHVQVRAGARGNPLDKGATMRDLEGLSKTVVNSLSTTSNSSTTNALQIQLGSGVTASVAIDAFTTALKNTQLYKDLMKSIDDPTRFSSMPAVVQQALLTGLSEEAAARGAAITQVQTIIQSTAESLAMQINEITAAVDGSNAAIRDTSYAYANANNAQAGKISQLVASLSGVGTAELETVYQVIADRINGLSSQYTLKVRAGGAIAGYGISATQDIAGNQTSAFIIEAGMFGIVEPGYNLGQQNAPPTSSIPFGVDQNGIYLNDTVYIRGGIMIDSPDKGLIPLANGLRGSVDVVVGGQNAGWDDNKARYAIWEYVRQGIQGRNYDYPYDNSFLVIGDRVTIVQDNTLQNSPAWTKDWVGWEWFDPGTVINGNMLVNGTVSAQKIDTRGLEISSSTGQVLLGENTPLNASYITGLTSQHIAGLGALATQNAAQIGSSVTFPDGSVMGIGQFVNTLSKISNYNVDAFISDAAIGNAQIGNLAVSTLTIQDNAVTIPFFSGSGDLTATNPPYGALITTPSYPWTLTSATHYLYANTLMMATASSQFQATGSHQVGMEIVLVGPSGGLMGNSGMTFGNTGTLVCQGSFLITVSGYYYIEVISFPTGSDVIYLMSSNLSAFGGMK